MKLEEIDLYLTNRCNIHCDFCSVQAHKASSEISFSKIKEIIIDGKELGLQELHLTGGEPTLRDDLEEIISFAVLQKLNVRLITNGTLLNKERLTKLVGCGLKSIMISLDGMKGYHNAVRGEKAYERAFETINNAITLGILVRVNSVAWLNNQNEIIQLANLLNIIGVHVYSIFLGSPLGYAKRQKYNIMDPLTWRKFCDLLHKIVSSESYKTKIVVEKGFLYPDEKNYDLSQLQGRGRGCHDITNYCDYLLIRSNGDVYPCVFFSNEANPIGNIHERSIESILTSFKENKFYEKIGQGPQECKTCKSFALCKGGCRGYAKLYTENWTLKDPRCNCAEALNIIPLCPIVKYYLNENRLGGSSEQVLQK